MRKCPCQFSKVKVRVLLCDWFICEATCTTHEYKKTKKGGEEEKNCYLKFKKPKFFFYNDLRWGKGNPHSRLKSLISYLLTTQSELMFLPSSSDQFGKFGINY